MDEEILKPFSNEFRVELEELKNKFPLFEWEENKEVWEYIYIRGAGWSSSNGLFFEQVIEMNNNVKNAILKILDKHYPPTDKTRHTPQ